MSAYKLKKACKQLIDSGYIDIQKSTIKGYSTCILLLYPHTSAPNPLKKTESEGYRKDICSEQVKIDSFFSPPTQADCNKARNLNTAPELDIGDAIERAIRSALETLNNNTAVEKKNTTENDTIIYYKPQINITINMGSLPVSSEISNKEQTRTEEFSCCIKDSSPSASLLARGA